MDNLRSYLDKLADLDLGRLPSSPVPPWLGGMLREQLATRPDWEGLLSRLPGIDKFWKVPDGVTSPSDPPVRAPGSGDHLVVLPVFAMSIPRA